MRSRLTLPPYFWYFWLPAAPRTWLKSSWWMRPSGDRYGFSAAAAGGFVAEVRGDAVGPSMVWPLPAGCVTAWGGNRRPTWEDDNHLLLVTPHGTLPGTRVIRVDVTTGTVERVNIDRASGG
jgi:hypothetical protein